MLRRLFAATASMMVSLATAAPLQFRHHTIDPAAETPPGTIGFAMTALADLDRDGDLDLIVGHRGGGDLLHWYEYRGPGEWLRHRIGADHQSDVGAAVLDVDRDGWLDVVCGGAWFRNPAPPRDREFERHVFDPAAKGAHDVVLADVDRDGRRDVVVMGDGRTALKSLAWYAVPADPRGRWQRRPIGSPVHGAIAPGAIFDVDGDGDVDVVRADTWFENTGNFTAEWPAHKNVPIGRTGPYGMCVRAQAADLNGDGRLELVVLDADIVPCGAYILHNGDGRGTNWEKQSLPQSFPYGSLHSLAVGDFDGDGDLDIVANEQEDMLPEGRENPRWVIWENAGRGRFVEHIVLDQKLGGHELVVGDVDGDGDLDICSKPWRVKPWNSASGKLHIDFLENRQVVRKPRVTLK